jgi:ABC-type amino acid transport substrate-binding protein
MSNDHHASRNTQYLILILAIVLVVLWFAPDVVASFNRKPDQAWARIQKDHIIRFAIDASYMPFDGLGSHNDFYGIDVDIANEVARRIGMQSQFVLVSFDSLYDVLKVGQADATISALIVDPTRQADWKYSTPYFETGLILVVHKGSSLLRTDDLARHTLSVEYGSDADTEARYLARRIDQIKIVYAGSVDEVLQNMLNDNVDAAIIDGVSAAQALPKYPGLRGVQQLTHDSYAIAVWGDSTQLLAAINSALSAMQQDGMIDRITNEWMQK